MDPAEEEEILRVFLELVFEDGPTPRREGKKGEGGEGGVFARRRWEGERWVWVCLTRTGRFWVSSNIALPPS